ncbi:hypothetical protein [Tistrella mobilis]|uniref:hypothetical protein n=1 Tax=Tistrella mobilis TaxID=171437 RepID=UPI003558E617
MTETVDTPPRPAAADELAGRAGRRDRLEPGRAWVARAAAEAAERARRRDG